MSDKIRGAIFNLLGDVQGLSVLDAFAGSGALGFEAISRGATHALLIEIDKKALSTIEQNIKTLELEDRVKLSKRNIKAWSDENLNKKFDIVFCDPPYTDVSESITFKLSRHVNEAGILVVSCPDDLQLPAWSEFEIVSQKIYGNAKIVVYKHRQVSA